MKNIDVVILGGGSAGLTAYREVKKAGRTALIINEGSDGTTCARVGCMPSKAFIQIAQDFSKTESFAERGVDNSNQLKINFPQLMAQVRKLRDHFVEGVLEEVKEFEDDYIKGQAQFISLNRLELNGEIIEAENIIIATGSHPRIPEEWKEFSSFFITSDDFFELKELPQNIAILGLGAVGLEIGCALSQLGIKVTGFCERKFVGGLTDPEVSKIAQDIIEKKFPLHLGEKINLSSEKNKLIVTYKNKQYTYDKVLVSTGRTPNLKRLGLQKNSLHLDKNGVPLFDRSTMKVQNAPIFLAGDVTAEQANLPQAVDEASFLPSRN